MTTRPDSPRPDDLGSPLPLLRTGLEFVEVLSPLDRSATDTANRNHGQNFGGQTQSRYFSERAGPSTHSPLVYRPHRDRPLSPSPPASFARIPRPRKFTPWILRLDTTSHKCVDLHLFRPQAGSSMRFVRSDNTQHTGTVVLPILPGPVSRFNFDVSVMTLSQTLFTPNAEYSELSWPVLQAQGFTKHDFHHNHEHDSTWTDPVHMHTAPCPHTTGDGRRRRASSVIRHPHIPGVDLLWCGYDEASSPHTFVHMTACHMVNVDYWSEGVRLGAVGRAADMDGNVGWVESGEHSLFEMIVQGGLGDESD